MPKEYFCDNFGKYGPILTILSLLHSKRTAELAAVSPTISPQICCCTTLLNLTVQLDNFAAKICDSKVMQCRLFTTNIYTPHIMFSIACLCGLIRNITAHHQNVRHLNARMLWVVHATQWCVDDVLLTLLFIISRHCQKRSKSLRIKLES